MEWYGCGEQASDWHSYLVVLCLYNTLMSVSGEDVIDLTGVAD